ncbi:MAG: hypothetical protein GXP55_02865 [Deltaproteobacteria bacterium]|nr:hypothetical protein [Deltaproteobacteria bacterium]
MRYLFLVLVFALACSSNNGATSVDAATGTDASDLCRGAADPGSVLIPAANCAPACTPSAFPTGGGSESTCYNGCNWCECTCAGPSFCTANACLDASMPDAAVDSSIADSGSMDAMVSDAATDAGTDASPRLDGATDGSCSAASPCTGGAVCIGGPACGDSWTCSVLGVACTDDIVSYCGCDGSSFTGSSTCASQPIAHLGSCEAGANCNSSAVTCRRVEPVCPDGQAPEVQGSCWTDRCIPIDECACSTPAECPSRDVYTCYSTTGRCGPYL